MRVLVVDRDPFLRRGCAQLLPRFRVDAAARVEDALAAVAQNTYQALVVEERIGAPCPRAGLELVRVVRDRRSDAGIVLTSDAIGAELRAEAKAVGVDALLRRDEIEGPVLRALLEEAVATRAGAGDADNVELPHPLRALVEDARDALAEGRRVQATQIHRFALVARAALSDTSGGRGVAIRCAQELGLTHHSLQAYALLASRFSAEELRELLATRRNVHGVHLTVSHLQLLAKLPRRTRIVWIERAFSEGLTVRQLRKVVSDVRRGSRAP